MKTVDLHTHSDASDGTFSPDEVVRLAKKSGLSAVALTDHDTVSGIAKAMEAGKKYGIEVVPGIELSSAYGDTEIHIVGLYINYTDEWFINALRPLQNTREERNEKITAKLRERCIDITLPALRDMFGEDAVLTRAHFASYLTANGYTKDNKAAFDKYLGADKPCFVPRYKIPPKETIELIKSVGGIPILAHPLLYKLSMPELRKLTAYLSNIGLIGIEALYSTYRGFDENVVRGMAKDNNLIISGGSDFHGDNKPYIHIGVGRGNLRISYAYLDIIKKYR